MTGKIKKNHRDLINKVVKEFDWDSVLKVHKIFGLGVGTPSDFIPGVKLKTFQEGIEISDLKNELRCLLKHMVINDMPSFQYGYWVVSWTSDEWEFDLGAIEDSEEDMDEDLEESGPLFFTLRPRFEVLFCPGRIIFSGEKEEKLVDQDNPEDSKLEEMLKKALAQENFEQAAKIRDLIKVRNKNAGRDK